MKLLKIALTEKQKLALEQELAFRRQGFAAFSEQTDTGFQRNSEQGPSFSRGC